MARETTYTAARANFATLCDRVIHEGESVVIHRRGAEDVALISASELSSLQETAHLLRSPVNAARLRQALRRAEKSSGKPSTVSTIRRKFHLGSV
jgi:antitoxin YefM